jgi:hypothetical protein
MSSSRAERIGKAAAKRYLATDLGLYFNLDELAYIGYPRCSQEVLDEAQSEAQWRALRGDQHTITQLEYLAKDVFELENHYTWDNEEARLEVLRIGQERWAEVLNGIPTLATRREITPDSLLAYLQCIREGGEVAPLQTVLPPLVTMWYNVEVEAVDEEVVQEEIAEEQAHYEWYGVEEDIEEVIEEEVAKGEVTEGEVTEEEVTEEEVTEEEVAKEKVAEQVTKKVDLRHLVGIVQQALVSKDSNNDSGANPGKRSRDEFDGDSGSDGDESYRDEESPPPQKKRQTISQPTNAATTPAPTTTPAATTTPAPTTNSSTTTSTKKKSPGWSQHEKTILMNTFMAYWNECHNSKGTKNEIVRLKDKPLWELMSARLKLQGVDRTYLACKNTWGRGLRAEVQRMYGTGVDDRAESGGRSGLTSTSVQKK